MRYTIRSGSTTGSGRRISASINEKAAVDAPIASDRADDRRPRHERILAQHTQAEPNIPTHRVEPGNQFDLAAGLPQPERAVSRRRASSAASSGVSPAPVNSSARASRWTCGLAVARSYPTVAAFRAKVGQVKRLPPRVQKFVELYLANGRNGTDACRGAGYKGNDNDNVLAVPFAVMSSRRGTTCTATKYLCS